MNLEPVLLDDETVARLFRLVRSPAHLLTLENALVDLGYEQSLAIKLAERPHLTPLRLKQYLKEVRRRWIRDQVKHHLKLGDLKQMIINEEVDLFTMIFFSQQPEVVKGLERAWRLNVTGTMTGLLQNYRTKYYTRYGRTAVPYQYFCVGRYGHLENLEDIDPGDLDLMDTAAGAVFAGHNDMAKRIMRHYGVLDDDNKLTLGPDRILMCRSAASGGNLEFMEEYYQCLILPTDNDICDEMLRQAAQAGQMAMLQFLTQRHDYSVDSAFTAFKVALDNDQVEAAKFLMDYKPFDVASYINTYDVDKIFKRDHDNRQAVILFLITYGKPDMIRILLDAVHHGDRELIDVVLSHEYFALPHQIQYRCYNLHAARQAVISGHMDLMYYFLSRYSKRPSKLDILWLVEVAAESDETEIALDLLYSIDDINKNGYGKLSYLVTRYVNFEILEYLVRHRLLDDIEAIHGANESGNQRVKDIVLAY